MFGTLLFLSVLLRQVSGAGVTCQSPWFQLAYNPNYFLISDLPAMFAEVERFCDDLGGHVASITSEQDYWSLKAHLGKFHKFLCNHTTCPINIYTCIQFLFQFSSKPFLEKVFL